MNNDWIALLQQQTQLDKVLETTQNTLQFGLTLSRQDAELILQEHGKTLREQKRVEFGTGITPKIIYEFCDSAYINQDNYVEMIIRLQSIFYLFKNEMQDAITDDELLHFMKEQFEGICFGDTEYLESTCLANFSRAVRAGYDGYKASGCRGEYDMFDEVKRWDRDLYLETLKELF